MAFFWLYRGFFGRLTFLMHYIIRFTHSCFSQVSFPLHHTNLFSTHRAPLHFSTSCSVESSQHSPSIEQHLCTATSLCFFLPSTQTHTHICSPAHLLALSMSLTFECAVSEVQSIVLPGLADLCCFVDRIPTRLVLCPPKYCSPSTPRIREQHG